MVEVTERFYGKAFALNGNSKEFVSKVNGVKGWHCEIIRDKGCLVSQLSFKTEYESKEDYEKNFTVMNNDFVKGLELFGYAIADFDETKVKVSVLEYKKPTTFKEWKNKK